VSDLGKLIRERRQDRRWSLRQLGEKIGVTPAYVADLEAGRRSPGAELKERIAAALDISPENLAAADARLSADLRDWIEERPPLTAVLRSLHASPNSDRLIQRLGRFISRRPQVGACCELLERAPTREKSDGFSVSPCAAVCRSLLYPKGKKGATCERNAQEPHVAEITSRVSVGQMPDAGNTFGFRDEDRLGSAACRAN